MAIPILAASLIGGLISAASHIVGKVLIALGIGYASYQGIDVLMTFIKTQALSGMSGLPAGVIGLIGVMKIGVVFNIIFSAISARMVLLGITSGALKRMVHK